jgi:hypothetical protein
VVESSALLKRHTPKGYRGFESLPHRVLRISGGAESGGREATWRTHAEWLKPDGPFSAGRRSFLTLGGCAGRASASADRVLVGPVKNT